VDVNEHYAPDFSMFRPEDAPGFATHIAGPANATLFHGNGNWIQYPPDLGNQWALLAHYGSLRPPESYWLAPGGMVLITPNGERRLLGHPYNSSAVYNFLSFAKFSPDGYYVLLTSNMDDQCSNTACNTGCWADGTHSNAGTSAIRKVMQPEGCDPGGGCLTKACGRSDVFLAELPTSGS